MTTPSKTPITDAMLKKPGFSPSEWIKSHRTLEEAAQGLADRCREMVAHIRDCDERQLLKCDIDLHPPSVFSVYADEMESELARFDALKEGK